MQTNEVPKRCAEDTAEWFKRNHSNPAKPAGSPGDGSMSTVALEYQGHYSQAKHACFAVFSQMTSFKSGLHSGSRDYVEVTHTLWNVEENAKLGVYAVKNVETMTACNVLEASCTSKEQWLEMAKPYIAE